MNQKGFNFRSFSSLFLLLAMIIELVTGIVLYIAPAGRVAHWTNWEFWALTKEQWQSLHTLFGYVFVIVGVVHLYYNWKVLLNYLTRKIGTVRQYRAEIIVTMVSTSLLWICSVYDLPPANWVMNFGEYATESWERKSEEPPIPHAERLTFEELATQVKIPIEKIVVRLKEAHLDVDLSITLEEAGKKLKMPPIEIYRLVTRKETQSGEDSQFAGSGLGMKSLREVASTLDIPLENILKRLGDGGIVATAEDSIRDISKKYEMSPGDVIKLIQDKK